MTDGEALLRGVLADPFCNVPRLVYADWLEENGEPERAEFIRAHIEASEYEKTSKRLNTCKCDGGNNSCETCQDEHIWNAHQTRLLMLFKSFTPTEKYSIRVFINHDGSIDFTGTPRHMKTMKCGFVSSVTYFGLESFYGNFRMHFRQHPIHSVIITDRFPMKSVFSNAGPNNQYLFVKSSPNLVGNDPANLTADIFDEMDLTWFNRTIGELDSAYFSTQSEGREALSRTLVNYSRVRVGLERLKFPAYA
jgi:uncharacterized protein (TIGR02996 family)